MRIISTEVRFMFILDAIFPCREDTPQWGRQPFRSAQTLFSISRKIRAGGASKPADPEDVRVRAFMKGERHPSFRFAHAPYIYNPATADERIREYTLSMMKSELEFLESIPGSLYNFHPGAHVKGGQRGRMPSDRGMSEYAPHGRIWQQRFS